MLIGLSIPSPLVAETNEDEERIIARWRTKNEDVVGYVSLLNKVEDEKEVAAVEEEENIIYSL